jgi:starvation-inducible DNA-binding protein
VLSDALKQFLASTFAYYLKAQYFIGMLKALTLVNYMRFLQKFTKMLTVPLIITAEYVRTEEEYAPGSFERFQELSLIQGQTKVPRARLMLEELLADTQTMKDLSKSLFDAAGEVGREDIANFAAERQSSHGKYLWQLKSYLKDARA